MALQIWLPLNGNLDNKGVLDKQGAKSGTVAYTSAGKLNTSLTMDGLYLKYPYTNTSEQITVAFWIKPNSPALWTDIMSFGDNNRLEVNDSAGTCHWYSNTTGLIGGADLFVLPSQVWSHVAFSASGTVVDFYLNGEKKKTVIQTNTLQSVLSSNRNIFINARTDNSQAGKYTGSMNDFRVYDEYMSPKQIKDLSKLLMVHYPLTGPGGCENLILTSDRVVSGSQGTGITRTYEADGSIKIVSESGNGNYCSLGFAQNSNDNVGAKMAVGDSYVVSCDIKVESGTAFPTLFLNGGNNYKALQGDITKLGEWQRVYYKSTWGEPGTSYGNISIHLGFSGAIGTYYFKNFKLEKGTELTAWTPAPTDDAYIIGRYKESWGEDCSGYDYHGSVVGTPGFGAKSPKYHGNIQMFGSYINKLPSPLTTNTDAFTFMCWYCPTAHTTGALYNNRTVVGSGVSVFHIGETIRFDTGSASQLTASTTLVLNKWQHIACVYDKNNTIKKIYINGVQVGSTSTIGDLTEIGSIASMGASSANNAGGGNTLSGAMSDARIYGTALSETEIKAIYNNITFIDNENNIGCIEALESGELLEFAEYPTSHANHNGTYVRTVVDDVDSPSGKATKLECTVAGTGFYMNAGTWNNAKLKMVHGQKYTVSMYVKANRSRNYNMSVECSSSQSRTSWPIGTEYQLVMNTFTYSAETTYSALTNYATYEVGDILWMHSFKIEKLGDTPSLNNNGAWEASTFEESGRARININKIEVNNLIEI